MSIPTDYLERVYAGVLGKIIGIYLGRPFEGWTYERIMAELGEIWYYVHDRLGKPLVVTDDDITGTFTFIRALADHSLRNGSLALSGEPILTSEQVGQTWLNYIIENQSILWWGGLGQSTEHTAFLRLKQGIPAPRSGSIALNGRVTAEQIGAQIFIDGWGMVCPGDPEKAAALAAQAARVSHDGEAVYAAQIIAALEAGAFVEPDLDALLDTVTGLIPADSTIYRLITDLRGWRAVLPDWRSARAKIAEHYGYDSYPGNCHVVPNHALIHLGLLYGDTFQKALMITNTAGWDTDCNSANVGCIMGIRLGLAGIDAGPDWRGPVADQIFLPTADGGWAINDAVQQTYFMANLGRALQDMPPLRPKGGARFHFELPGCVQSFRAKASHETAGHLSIFNIEGHSAEGTHSLALEYHHLAPGRRARAAVPTFIPPDAVRMEGYALAACPTLYPGQTIRARLSADPFNQGPVQARLYVSVYNTYNQLDQVDGPVTILLPGSQHAFEWPLTDRTLTPIAQVGIELSSERFAEGRLYLDCLTWDGAPDVSLLRPGEDSAAHTPKGSASLWQRAWIKAVDLVSERAADWGIIQNRGRGLFIQGTRQWTDYRASAVLCPHLVSAGGIAVRVQGLRRYYALLFKTPGQIQLVKQLDGQETCLASTEWAWDFEQEIGLALQAEGNHLKAWANGVLLFDTADPDRPLLDGALALVVEEGHLAIRSVDVGPV